VFIDVLFVLTIAFVVGNNRCRFFMFLTIPANKGVSKGGLVLNPPLELDILRRPHYLRKRD